MAQPPGRKTSPADMPGQPRAVKRKIPDPRYRAPAGLTELKQIARMVGRASGTSIRGNVILAAEQSPLCVVTGNAANAVIKINPEASRNVPPNTWAFIFGHEFVHQMKHMGSGGTSPELEKEADIIGAGYAIKAGFRLESFIAWMRLQPDDRTDSHGSLRGRARALARHYQISERAIQEETRRYSGNRSGPERPR